MLTVGTLPEDVELNDQSGAPIRLSDTRGTPAVFFFYPKASTPGCTKEACAFNDMEARFEALGVKVYGISADSVKRQSNFATKYGLRMPLLSDPERQVIEGWGVWQEKKNYGRTYMGIVRSTFLFNADGTLAHVWPKVRVKGHVEAVLAEATQRYGS